MKEGFDTKFLNSFYCWLDHRILKDGEGYTKTSSLLFNKPQDPYFPNNSYYSSPYKQWVWDTSVGANVPSGVSGSAGFINKGTNGLFIDHLNGRAGFSGVYNDNISGSYSVKKFNIYVSNDDEESLIFKNRHQFNPKIGKAYSGIAPYDMVLPGIFINYFNSRNDPFAFGGMDESKVTVRLTVIGDKYQDFVNLISLLKDSARMVFPLISTQDLPLNINGDFKSSPYNYEQLRDAAMQTNDVAYIDAVSYMQLVDKSIQDKDELVGFVNFNINCARYPRI